MTQPTSTATAVLDPVCGMFVDPASAAGAATYGGETYAFCSVFCKTAFEAEPEEYAGAKTRSGACCSAR